MGKLNLIQSHWTGQVGAYTGQRYKGRSVIKSNEHKKRHPNVAQTKSVRAFECLNRFASGCVGKLWGYTGLNDKKMLKHNALAADWKKLISEKKFSPENLNQIYAQSALDVQTEINISLDNENVVVNWTIPEYDSTLYKLYGVIIDSRGNVLFIDEMPTGQIVSKVITSYCNLGDWIFCPCFLVTLPTSTEKATIEVILGEKEVYIDEKESVFSVNVTRDNAVLTANITTEQPLNFTYQWYKDNVAISGATANTYTITKTGTYKVEATVANTPGYSEKTEEGELTYQWNLTRKYLFVYKAYTVNTEIPFKRYVLYCQGTGPTQSRAVSVSTSTQTTIPTPWKKRSGNEFTTVDGTLRQEPTMTIKWELKDDIGVTQTLTSTTQGSFYGTKDL